MCAPPPGHTMPCTHSHQYVQTIADLLRSEPTETLARGWAEAPRAVGWRKPARHAPAERRDLILRGRRRRFRVQKAGWIPLKRADQPERASSGGQEPASGLTCGDTRNRSNNTRGIMMASAIVDFEFRQTTILCK